jgi:hypothetical protein
MSVASAVRRFPAMEIHQLDAAVVMPAFARRGIRSPPDRLIHRSAPWEVLIITTC